MLSAVICFVECPNAEDGMERFACPTPDPLGRYRCIDDHVLCDGFLDCPDGSDEDRHSCMFYKTVRTLCSICIYFSHSSGTDNNEINNTFDEDKMT